MLFDLEIPILTATVSDSKTCGMVRRKWPTKSTVITSRELKRRGQDYEVFWAMTSTACKKESLRSRYLDRQKSKRQAASRG